MKEETPDCVRSKTADKSLSPPNETCFWAPAFGLALGIFNGKTECFVSLKDVPRLHLSPDFIANLNALMIIIKIPIALIASHPDCPWWLVPGAGSWTRELVLTLEALGVCCVSCCVACGGSAIYVSSLIALAQVPAVAAGRWLCSLLDWLVLSWEVSSSRQSGIPFPLHP